MSIPGDLVEVDLKGPNVMTPEELEVLGVEAAPAWAVADLKALEESEDENPL